jgi:hydrogenase maturation protein HypF
MELEFAQMDSEVPIAYPWGLVEPPTDQHPVPPARAADSQPGIGLQPAVRRSPQLKVLDWAPLVNELLSDVRRGTPLSTISHRFHSSLSQLILSVARSVGQERVVLSGGCFQNRVLLEGSIELLRRHGLRPYWHQRVPTNDGGIAVGQVYGAMKWAR